VSTGQQIPLKCAQCGTESKYALEALVMQTARCLSCGRSFVKEGRGWARHIDEANAFYYWAEVLIGTEDLLGIPYPGIPDGDVLGNKPLPDHTLREIVQTVEAHIRNETVAISKVLESATKLANRPILAEHLDLPILQAFGVEEWSRKWE